MSDLTALRDQAQAAADDAGRLLATAAAELAEQGEPVLRLKGAHAFQRRLHTQMGAALSAARAAGERPTCRHLDLTSPRVGFWLSASPARLLCAVCAQRWTRYYAGPEHCDLCGSRQGLFWGGHRLPVTVLERAGGRPPATLAGVVVRWTCCGDCMTSGESPPESQDG